MTRYQLEHVIRAAAAFFGAGDSCAGVATLAVFVDEPCVPVPRVGRLNMNAMV
jgi:hypothetical protein